MDPDRPEPLSRSVAGRLARSPALAAMMAGALAACGFQPLALWPFTFIGMAWLARLALTAPGARAAFLRGWLFGVAHFTLGDNWIATAFTYQAQMPAWLGGIAVVALSLYLAVFPGLAALAGWKLTRLAGAAAAPSIMPAPRAVAGFAAAWIVTEWMRGWVFTGFAWNPVGVALVGAFGSPGLARLAPWVGTYALSGLCVLIAGLGAWLIERAWASRGKTRARYAAIAAGLGLAVALTMVLPGWPSGTDGDAATNEGGIRYTLVQPDLRQATLDDPQYFENHFRKLARLTRPFRPGSRRLVLWPESGLADYLRDGYPYEYYYTFNYAADPGLARARVGKVIGPYGLLLTGGVDLVMRDGKVAAARNSVTALDGQGDILAGYAKAHLVPYGEYLPMRGLLEPLGASRLVAGALDFRPGPGPRTFDFGDYGKAGVQICYEIVFSGEVVDRRDRPDYIFNPSNDGWFGAWGPPQHLAQARLRAIEEGLPVLRSTTTGISAVIDADGIVRAYVPRHQARRLDGTIPLPHAPTPFARLGNALPLAIAALLLLAAVSPVARRRPRG